MKKLTLVLAVTLVLAPLSAVAAEREERAIEDLAVGLESLMGWIEGVDPADWSATTYDSGLTVYSIPLPEEMRAKLRAAGSSNTLAKDFAPLAVGLMLSDPTSFSSLISAVDALPSTEYNVWCAVANLRDTQQAKKTTVQMKGEC